MTGDEDGGSPRVSIPDSLRGTIQGIKEIAVNHSDEDIYGMLKECNMDSDETTQKLLYLDTFQLVKSKRKVRVTRDDSDNQFQYYSSDNSNGGRKLNSNLHRRPSKSSMPVPRKESSKSPAVGSSSHKMVSQPAKLNGFKADKDVKSRKDSSLGRVVAKHVSDPDPGSTPTSTPTNPSTPGSSARIVGGSFKPKQSKLGNGVCSSSASGLCPSSDPVLVPSLNIKNSFPVGTIKRETTKNQNVSQALVSGSVDLTSSNTQSQVNGSLKEMSEDPCSKNATSELDVKPRQSVIFPSHFHVPENFKNALTFGSFESNNQGSSDPGDHEAPPIPHSSSPISGHDDYPDQPSHAPLNLTSSEENILSGADLRYDQSEQEILQPVGRSNDSLLDYGSSLAPPAVQLQGLGTQGESSLLTTGTTPSPTQPTTGTTPSDPTQPRLGSSQSSAPASPQMFPFFRQTYPTNYVPYSPYLPYSPYYMPQQNVHHQLPGHNGYPHQPSAGDIYVPPAAASASGPKFPGYKPGSMTHFGTPSVYGSSASFPDDMSRTELKEKNMHSNLPPQGQVGHNSFPGMYHPSQSMPTQSLHQSQTPSVVPPSLSSYPQPQLLSLPQQQYGQQMSLKNFLN